MGAVSAALGVYQSIYNSLHHIERNERVRLCREWPGNGGEHMPFPSNWLQNRLWRERDSDPFLYMKQEISIYDVRVSAERIGLAALQRA
jgi:hypothetical protein